MKKIYTTILFLCFFTFSHKTDAQVTLLNDNNSLAGAPFNGKILLISDVDNTLWVSDGTAANTKQYAFNVKIDDDGGGYFLSNKAYFAGIDATHGSELWVTDGTAGGTTLVSDLNAGAGSSNPDNFFLFKNELYFTAATPALGRELYKINVSGTVSLFMNINPGGASGFSSSNGINFYSNNNLMYFTADNGVNGTELWVSDGTVPNTKMLTDITPGPVGTTFGLFSHLGNEVIFSITTAAPSQDLWKTNGTTVGTSLVKSFNAPGAYISGFIPLNNKLYITGTDAATGTELWSTDGTTTEMISDINPGPDGSYPQLFNAVIINNHIIFAANTDANGNELWISDGVKGGSTIILKDINPNAGDANPALFPAINLSYIANGGNSLDDIFNRTQLFNGFMFFSADDGINGTELWKTNGTAGGTSMVKDINSGAGEGLQNTGTYYYSSTGFYFAADDGSSGNEPWVTDGSPGGTSRVADINPGASGSDPNFYFIDNGSLFFTADNGNSATSYTDFYKINGPLSALPVTLLNFSAAAQSDAVQLAWVTSSEVNSSHFEIQRSVDGQHFTNIGNEDASGNSTTQKNYRYNDDKAYEAGANVLFYRLRMVDLDGKSKYSNVLSVKLKGAIMEMKVYPNPVHNQLSVSFSIPVAKNVTLRITGVSGKQYYNQRYTGGISSNLQNIDVSRLAKGTYFVQLITDKESKIIKFVKE